MINISSLPQEIEVTGVASKKREILKKCIFNVGLGFPCLFMFLFPFVLGESTLHSFYLNKEEENFDITLRSLLRYIDSFSDEMLESVSIRLIR